MNKLDTLLDQLKSLGRPENREGMARFGINIDNALGVPVTELRRIAKRTGKDHDLANQLWRTGIHEAMILATMIDEPGKVTLAQMEAWVKDFNSWDLCDQCCGNLFDKTRYAHEKAAQWSRRSEEYVKRAGFTLMAILAVHDKKATDKEFMKFLSLIVKGSMDDRNYVKKAVNWALRQIGKRNSKLKDVAIKTANEMMKLEAKSAHWVASDALRELRSR